jgi:glycosyltransferase involved in cell wall biosynthesis
LNQTALSDLAEPRMQRKVRVAYLVTHPIQYQAPLLRRLSEEPSIDLTVFFCSNFSVSTFRDPEFGARIAWDVPLLEGYKYEFLPAWGETDRVSFWRPWNHGLARRLRDGRFDILWIHGYRRWFHLASMVAARLMGKTVMLRDEATLISSHYGPLKKAAKRTFFGVLETLCSGFLAIGTLNKNYYLYFGVNEDRIFSVPYAVHNEYFLTAAESAEHNREELRTALGLEEGRPIILYASKLVSRKRPDDLLEAYVGLSPDSRAPAPYLIFIGEGESRPGLERRAAALGWDSIRFLGFKNQTELPRYYDLCDIFVLPSDREPWGLVINEVMNAGRAVVVSDRVGCAPDLVAHGQTGYIYQAGNVGALTDALRRIIEDPELCRSMGRNGLKRIRSWGFEEDVVELKRAFLHKWRPNGDGPSDSDLESKGMVLSGREQA